MDTTNTIRGRLFGALGALAVSAACGQGTTYVRDTAPPEPEKIVAALQAHLDPSPLVLGESSELITTATFEDGSTARFNPDMSLRSPATRLVDIAGWSFRPKRVGTGTVAVYKGDVRIHVEIEVAPGSSSVAGIHVPFEAATIAVDEALELSAEIELLDGTRVDGTSQVTWSVSNASTATITEGTLVGLERGVVALEVEHLGAWDRFQITVVD